MADVRSLRERWRGVPLALCPKRVCLVYDALCQDYNGSQSVKLLRRVTHRRVLPHGNAWLRKFAFRSRFAYDSGMVELDGERWLVGAELARVARISTARVRRLCLDKRLVARKCPCGREWLVSETSAVAWMDGESRRRYGSVAWRERLKALDAGYEQARLLDVESK